MIHDPPCQYLPQVDAFPWKTLPFRFHLANPPVGARSSFSYDSKRCGWYRLRETGEGVQKPLATILVIDDEESVRTLWQVALERAGHHVLIAGNGKQGLRLLEHQAVDLIFVDIFMPEMDGLELITLLRKTRPAIKMIAVSGGSGLRDYLEAAKNLGAHDTLKKPFSLQELLDAAAAQLK